MNTVQAAYKIYRILLVESGWGSDLLNQLNAGIPWWAFWRRWSRPAFYRLMTQLEGKIKGEWRLRTAGGVLGRSRWYSLQRASTVAERRVKGLEKI